MLRELVTPYIKPMLSYKINQNFSYKLYHSEKLYRLYHIILPDIEYSERESVS